MFLLTLLFSLLVSFYSGADMVQRADAHAPIGVMGDHGHHKGDFMFSYRAMLMRMDGMRDGTRSLSTNEVLTGSMMAPEKMDMWMHMLGAMYGVTDSLTLMAMIPYLSNEMIMERRMQRDRIAGNSEGLGDVSVTAMYSVLHGNGENAMINLGLGLPTGSIDEDNNGARQGYPMQLGSGSFYLQPQIVYTKLWANYSFGAQTGVRFFLDTNKNSYKRGSQHMVNVWGARSFCESLSSSLRLSYLGVEPITGADPAMGTMSPVLDAGLQHGQTASAYLGLNFFGGESLAGHRLAFEVGVPFYQDLTGPQMQRTFELILGWQKAL